VDRADDIHTLSDDLPVLGDDDAADHLLDAVVPSRLDAADAPDAAIDDGRVTHAFYPVFPPDAHAAEVLSWLRV
jgi:hypothetical protein